MNYKLIKFNKFDARTILYNQTKTLNIDTLVFLLKNSNNFKTIFLIMQFNFDLYLN